MNGLLQQHFPQTYGEKGITMKRALEFISEKFNGITVVIAASGMVLGLAKLVISISRLDVTAGDVWGAGLVLLTGNVLIYAALLARRSENWTYTRPDKKWENF